MSTITDKLTYLQDTKTAIKNAIVNKGVSVSDSDTFRSYANKISSITTGEGGGSSDEWQPQPDWWDIESILENDTEDYAGKTISLMRVDNVETMDIYRMGANKVLLSDGTEYIGTDNFFSHTWDTTKDKECNLGYKTRYVIRYYSNNTNFILSGNLNKDKCLYFILKDFIDIQFTWQSAVDNSLFNEVKTIEAVKAINVSLKPANTTYNDVLNFSSCHSLRKVEGFNINNEIARIKVNFGNCYALSEIPSFLNHSNSGFEYGGLNTNYKIKELGDIYLFGDSCLYNCAALEKVGFVDTSKLTRTMNIFFNCFNLKTIGKIDLATDQGSRPFQTSANLISIDEVYNIVASGYNFSLSILLNHDTLIRILNALYDYASEGSSATHTLILGAPNLAKLTDEEKAIATNKGWTLN
jgi:hypothetical protein